LRDSRPVLGWRPAGAACDRIGAAASALVGAGRDIYKKIGKKIDMHRYDLGLDTSRRGKGHEP
jgi:hypothetical protein